MKQLLIITFIFTCFILSCGCSSDQPAETKSPTQNQELISDRYGFILHDLDGFEEDKERSDYAWNILTLRKDDIRVQFGYLKDIRVISDIPGVPSPSVENLLTNWIVGMMETPWFYPATQKSILKSEYLNIGGYKAIATDMLLEFNQDDLDELDQSVRKVSDEEIKFYEKHPRTLLRTYHFYRGKDLFHIEFFTDPLTFQAEIYDFDSRVVGAMELMDAGV